MPTPAQSQARALARAGRAQLDQRLDTIMREVARLTELAEQTATTRRASGAIRAEIERARSVAAALERLIALERVSLRLGQVEVSDLLIAALSHWKTRAPERTFELALPGHEPKLLGDGALIEQAIEGLIAWAAACSAPGDIRVSLRPMHPAETDASGDIIIAVRCPLRATDNLQPTHLFERIPAPQADDAGGLELTLARAVAERHGGRAWAEVSAMEQALTLSLALPTAPTPAALVSQLDMGAHDPADGVDGAAAAGVPELARARKVIVVAHADARMARYLRANLEAAEFSAKTATTLSATLKLIELEEPDLALLDLALPDDQQREPLARTLARTTAPVIALGPSGDPSACVCALDAGAVDYIAQPLSVEETIARIRRALRPGPGHAADARQRIITCGDLVIDDTQRLVTVGGTPAQLSKTEYRLLRTLAQNLGKTLSHEALLAQVWGPAYSEEIEFIWVYIRRLRRKIEPDPARPRYILTAPGVGYRLAQPSAQRMP
ncbi:MAG TPA: winged helix-turn-helix domain-containing protein [Ktedonobacterales bacterium]|nr:winged helix-turn-helix domain-containing protein [Ktedonobacterales bacterium]